MVGMLNRIGRFQPTARWFILAIALGVLLVEAPILALLFPSHIESDWSQIVFVAFSLAYATVHGLLYFPLGLWAVFIHDFESAREFWAIFAYVGWSVFLVLTAAGLQYPRRLLFAILALLLVINAVGYPTRDMVHHIEDSLMW